MESLEAELERARGLAVDEIADAIEEIGFECTRCGACCTREADDPHTATVFPDEVRALESEDRPWNDVARPMPYGLEDGEGQTFEWALQTDGCGDCVFYEESEGVGACSVHPDRPLICRTYPFSVALAGTTQPMGEAVDEKGIVRAHECEGLGREISRGDAEELAQALKERAVRELEEAIGVRENYRPVEEETVVYDSEGPKRVDGSEIDDTNSRS
ncbi:MAG: YkgJ family cysteine cluster protein [Euryarchaeota archaeon]|jgi:Fe-S-cluster containining protein|nr:YkgJ family cysteine cluster protein [Euryarchaeota archaeon]